MAVLYGYRTMASVSIKRWTVLISEQQMYCYGSRDFLLLSRLDDINISNVERAPTALGLLAIFIGLAVTGIVPTVLTALYNAGGTGVSVIENAVGRFSH